jgi:hypothetical protein
MNRIAEERTALRCAAIVATHLEHGEFVHGGRYDCAEAIIKEIQMEFRLAPYEFISHGRQVENVDCPRCGAAAGQICRVEFNSGPATKKPHQERIDAWHVWATLDVSPTLSRVNDGPLRGIRRRK